MRATGIGLGQRAAVDRWSCSWSRSRPCADGNYRIGGGGGGDVPVVAPRHSAFSGKLTANGGIDLGGPTVVVSNAPRNVNGTPGNTFIGS